MVRPKQNVRTGRAYEKLEDPLNEMPYTHNLTAVFTEQ